MSNGFLALLIMIVVDKIKEITKGNENNIALFLFVILTPLIAIAFPILAVLSILIYGFTAAIKDPTSAPIIIFAVIEVIELTVAVIFAYVKHYPKCNKNIKYYDKNQKEIEFEKAKNRIKNEIELIMLFCIILDIMIFPIIMLIA